MNWTVILFAVLVATALVPGGQGGFLSVLSSIAQITSTSTSIANLALNLANVISDGCIYEPEICRLKPEIEKLEKQIQAKYDQLQKLDKQNHELYSKVDLIIIKNEELLERKDKIQYKVARITVQTKNDAELNQLGEDFERNTQKTMSTFNKLVSEYSKMVNKKFIISLAVELPKLLFFTNKVTYKEAKQSTAITRPNQFANYIKSFTVALGKIYPQLGTAIKMVNRVTTSFSSISRFFGNPTVKKTINTMGNVGIIVVSLASLGLQVYTGVKSAKAMRDQFRGVKNDLLAMQSELENQYQSEIKVQKDLNTALRECKNAFKEARDFISAQFNVALPTNKYSDAAINRMSASALLTAQDDALTKYNKIDDLAKEFKLSVDAITHIRIASDGSQAWGSDPVVRIVYDLKARAYGTFREDQVYCIIAALYPDKNNYMGTSLTRYQNC